MTGKDFLGGGKSRPSKSARTFRPLFAGAAVALCVHLGGGNWWLAGAAAYSLVNVLWTIWGAAE